MATTCCSTLWVRGSFMRCSTGNGFAASSAAHRIARVLVTSEGTGMLCSARYMSSSTHDTCGKEIRGALRVLSLADDATDSDIRSRFHEIAKSNHPDVLRGNSVSGGEEGASPSPSATGENMRRGVEAYKLLRRYSMEERQMILHSSSEGHDAAQRRAQRVYQGQPRSGAPLGAGRSRTAEFNRFHARMEKMQEGSPPWRADDVQMMGRSAQTLFVTFGWGGSASQVASDHVLRKQQHGDKVDGTRRCSKFPPSAFPSVLPKLAAATRGSPVGVLAMFIVLVFIAMLYITLLRPRILQRYSVAIPVLGGRVEEEERQQ